MISSKVAFLFPGQGSQYVGMGLELASSFSSAREVFAELDDVLGEDLSECIFRGSESDLRQTSNTQPALYAVSLAVMRVMERDFSISPGLLPLVVAGHSLGEYVALTVAGVIGFRDGVRLLRLRGEAMQSSVSTDEGLMAAILGLDVMAVEKVASEVSVSGGLRDVCVVANDNSNGQVVLSGKRECVERAIDLCKASGAKRAIALDVSAPFHSPLMAGAESAMRVALRVDDEGVEASVAARDGIVDFKPPLFSVYPNVTARAEDDSSRLRELLIEQVCARVRWRETLLALERDGVVSAYEIGAGKVLSGMVRRTTAGISCSSVLSVSSLESTAEELRARWLG